MEEKDKLNNNIPEYTEAEKTKLKEEIETLIQQSKELKKIADEELKSENYETASKKYTEAIVNIKKIRAKQILTENELNTLIKELVVPSNLNLSLIDLKLNDWDNLINHSSKVLYVDKTNKKAKYRRCVGYINKQDFEKAQTDFEELKQQIGNSTEIKILEDMLINKKKSSGDEFYKKMSKQLHKANNTINYENKSALGKKIEDIKTFLYTKVLCCCFRKKKRALKNI